MFLIYYYSSKYIHMKLFNLVLQYLSNFHEYVMTLRNIKIRSPFSL